MKTYVAYFKMKFLNEIQYKISAIAGIATQFFWGAMYIMLYTAFINSNITATDMTISQLSTYVWLQQGFLMIFMMWSMDYEILELSVSGDIAYELTRPVKLYDIWFFKTVGSRLAKTILRATPIFIVCVFLPIGFNLALPVSVVAFILFLVTLLLSFFIVVAFVVLVYVICMKTVSYLGVRLAFCLTAEFLSGGVIPIPLMPEYMQNFIKFTPFYHTKLSQYLLSFLSNKSASFGPDVPA
jgi:ABC-2 type transport system permease protein